MAENSKIPNNIGDLENRDEDDDINEINPNVKITKFSLRDTDVRDRTLDDDLKVEVKNKDPEFDHLDLREDEQMKTDLDEDKKSRSSKTKI